MGETFEANQKNLKKQMEEAMEEAVDNDAIDSQVVDLYPNFNPLLPSTDGSFNNGINISAALKRKEPDYLRNDDDEYAPDSSDEESQKPIAKSSPQTALKK